MSDSEIGERYGISFSTLERIITEAYGANVSVLKRPKRIKRWQPTHFHEETTTVWSFKQRGNWATHDGRYRGNWSPYIPRNVILKYSRPGDVVLDHFVGGGTTAIEAKLLGRRCIARDINPGAVGITLENLKFSPPLELFGDGALPLYEPEVKVGDARDLSDISSDSIDLICAHPPYAGIVKYSTKIEGDLSSLPVQDFLMEMRKVARESFRVLKPGGKCAILIGDARKSKHVVPIGFQTIQVFLDAGFILRELVIKRQHNCKTTGFWYTRSVQYNFLLLAHEYLPIFEKPFGGCTKEEWPIKECVLSHQSKLEKVHRVEKGNLEATTVWVFPQDYIETGLKRNILQRFSKGSEEFVQIQFSCGEYHFLNLSSVKNARVLFVRLAEQFTERSFAAYRTAIKKMVAQVRACFPSDGFLILETRDFRVGGRLVPTGLLLWEDMMRQKDFVLKEIIIVAPEEVLREEREQTEYLEIVHRYLLVYRKGENSN
ncbi:MAG: methyltransferase domain-containing protein [Anaerolineae bacterium]|nr:methyltransferase domain-containing protein [Anaerolineae bacterium]